MPIQMDNLPLEVQIYINDTVDFLKGISAQLLPGVQELQRRDLLHRASVVFPIDDKESDIEEELTEDLLILNEQDENGQLGIFLTELEYALVRKSAKMIGSLFLLNRSCPTMKQRTTGVIFGGKLILYHNGRNPKTPLLLVDLEASVIIEGIEANCRFCIIDGSQTKHEFEALDEEERAEWVTELLKQQEMRDYEDEDNGIHPPINVYPSEDEIYEEVGEARLIYDVPKHRATAAAAATQEFESHHDSLSPPPPLPLRSINNSTLSVAKLKYELVDDEEDFPPPPAFDDMAKIVVPPPPPPPKPSTPVTVTIQPAAKMIPPPPPPHSNKIQIFSKSPLKALKKVTVSHGKTHEKPNIATRRDSTSEKSTNRRDSMIFDEELRQKIEIRKSFEFDESAFGQKGNNQRKFNRNEGELEAILKRRREKISTPATPTLSRKASLDTIKTFNRREFNTLPHRLKAVKPKVPEKKPIFVREHSLKVQSWNRISAGSEEEDFEGFEDFEEDEFDYLSS